MTLAYCTSIFLKLVTKLIATFAFLMYIKLYWKWSCLNSRRKAGFILIFNPKEIFNTLKFLAKLDQLLMVRVVN